MIPPLDSNLLIKLKNYDKLITLNSQMTAEESQHLCYITSLLPKQSTLVELGSRFGSSSAFLVSAMREFSIEGNLHCVDLWETGDQTKTYSSEYPVPAFTRGMGYHASYAHKKFIEQTESVGVRDRITEHKMSTDAFAETWTDPIDYMFIDADHLYDAVHKDWNNLNGFVKSGGFVSFHDYGCQFPGVLVVVDEEIDYTKWERFGVTRHLATVRKL